MVDPQKLWRCLTTEWVRLDPSLAWAWWHALSKASWSQATQWREQFLAFARRPERTAAEDVEAFLAETATPQQLVALLEGLIHEKVLLKRDGHRLEEALLKHVDASGDFHHQQGRRQTA